MAGLRSLPSVRGRILTTAHAALHAADRARPVCTAILFLLEEGRKSRLHRIPRDEIRHFYLGGTLRLVMIAPDGGTREVLLGQDLHAGEMVQFTVPAGSWFGAAPAPGSDFSLAGCTASPGFRMDEPELGEAFQIDELQQ